MRKAPFEWLKKPIKIGVYGLHPHAGVTRVTILIAEYLSNICGKNVAVMERGLRKDFNCLNPDLLKQGDCFKFRSITYGMQVNDCLIRNKELAPYDCYVYDLGSNYARARELFHTCDYIILLFTLTPWHFDCNRLRYAVERDYGLNNHIYFIGNMINYRERKLIHKVHKKVEYLDYEPNLYAPSKSAVQLFHEIFWD